MSCCLYHCLIEWGCVYDIPSPDWTNRFTYDKLTIEQKILLLYWCIKLAVRRMITTQNRDRNRSSSCNIKQRTDIKHQVSGELYSELHYQSSFFDFMPTFFSNTLWNQNTSKLQPNIVFWCEKHLTNGFVRLSFCPSVRPSLCHTFFTNLYSARLWRHHVSLLGKYT